MTPIRERYKPALPRVVLTAVAGAMWCCVGIMLSLLAVQWLTGYYGNPWLYAIPGIISALVIHHFGFLRIADRNLQRISRLPEKPCAFSFISWKSYIIIIVMITMGAILRHSPIPREYLSVIYMGIGLALFLSGIRYFRVFLVHILTMQK